MSHPTSYGSSDLILFGKKTSTHDENQVAKMKVCTFLCSGRLCVLECGVAGLGDNQGCK